MKNKSISQLNILYYVSLTLDTTLYFYSVILIFSSSISESTLLFGILKPKNFSPGKLGMRNSIYFILNPVISLLFLGSINLISLNFLCFLNPRVIK